MKRAWACLSLKSPIGFTIKVFPGSNQISLYITKIKFEFQNSFQVHIFHDHHLVNIMHSASSHVHCIISMIHYQVVYHSSCISHDHCTLHHHHMNTLHSQHASLNHPASTNLNMPIELDIVMSTRQIFLICYPALYFA